MQGGSSTRMLCRRNGSELYTGQHGVSALPLLPCVQGAQGAAGRGVAILVRPGPHRALPQPARPAGGSSE